MNVLQSLRGAFRCVSDAGSSSRGAISTIIFVFRIKSGEEFTENRAAATIFACVTFPENRQWNASGNSQSEFPSPRCAAPHTVFQFKLLSVSLSEKKTFLQRWVPRFKFVRGEQRAEKQVPTYIPENEHIPPSPTRVQAGYSYQHMIPSSPALSSEQREYDERHCFSWLVA